MATKDKKDKKEKTPEDKRANQEARLAFLKKNRPKDKEIAELEKKLGTPATSTPVTASPESEQAKKTTQEIMAEAEASGRRIADEYIPTGTFGKMETGITPEMQAALDRQNAYAQIAGNYTDNETFGIDQLKSGLGGYLAPELQALREQRLREVDAELATQTRQAALAAARGGIRGAYAGAQQGALGRQAVQTRGNMEQDLFAKNADVIQARREAFNNLVNQTEQTRFARKTGAEGQYAQTLGGEENVQRALKEFNLSQGTNEALARGGTALAGAGTYTGLYGTQYGLDEATKAREQAAADSAENFKILREQIKAQRDALNKSISNVGAGRV
jgi:hypothetical protein